MVDGHLLLEMDRRALFVPINYLETLRDLFLRMLIHLRNYVFQAIALISLLGQLVRIDFFAMDSQFPLSILFAPLYSLRYPGMVSDFE